MKKETQQLVMMLVIGILIGAVGTELWLGRNVTKNTLTDDVASVTTDDTSEATTTLSESLEKSKTSEVLQKSASQSVEFPKPSDIPANLRVGLSVEDQSAGSIIHITGLSITEPRWVAIYDERDGQPGWILGAKRFLSGDTEGDVMLLRATESGKKYYAVIHNDDGNLEFNKQLDGLPPTDSITIVSFMAK